MATGGRVRHHLKHNLWRAEASVVFVGYAATGTLARRIIDGAKQVEVLGEQIPVRARIYTINGFSGHADQAEQQLPPAAGKHRIFEHRRQPGKRPDLGVRSMFPEQLTQFVAQHRHQRDDQRGRSVGQEYRGAVHAVRHEYVEALGFQDREIRRGRDGRWRVQQCLTSGWAGGHDRSLQPLRRRVRRARRRPGHSGKTIAPIDHELLCHSRAAGDECGGLQTILCRIFGCCDGALVTAGRRAFGEIDGSCRFSIAPQKGDDRPADALAFAATVDHDGEFTAVQADKRAVRLHLFQ